MTGGTEFSLLGPLTVRWLGAAVPVPRGKQRIVLAALLLRANRVVTVDELAEALWGADVPPSARASVQNHVMRLRNALGPAAARITTQSHGYLIEVRDGELDIDRFEALVGDARLAIRQARWADAASQAAAALALWRSAPLAEMDSDLLAGREAPRLAELRLEALETRIGADLELGRHGAVISELQQLISGHPLRERLHAQLILALYRDGRQGEALAAYRHARTVLLDELGAEPGPGLRQLHQQVLSADPVLMLAGPAVQAAITVPRELPGDVAGFTGRATELAELSRILVTPGDQAGVAKSTAAVISAVSGTAGVGKTALAVHWAHNAADQFPDGQLYVNLRGYDPDRPKPATDALAAFLRSLGVPASDIPPDETERAARYRSLLAGKRIIVVLDNASSVEQVRPLLPGAPTCGAVVTSRDSLAGLVARDGAVRVELDLLPLADATALLRGLIGARVDAEPEAATALARQCARLPLALRVAAELATTRPQVPLASLVTELSDQQQRLDLLHGRDQATSVRAVFSWSYEQLGEAAALMFRLLGLHPGPDISAPAAGSLAAVPEPQARRMLGELARAHLITEQAPGRYAFHDLLHAYAADLVRRTDSDADRREAMGRVLDYYLHTAARAALLLMPAKERVVLAPARPGAAPTQLADYSRALQWFAAEHEVLLAAITLAAGSGFDCHAWQLPWAVASFLQLRGYRHEWADTQHSALAAATRAGDTAAQAMCCRLLAAACTELGDLDEARHHFEGSLARYEQLGDPLGQAKGHQGLGWLADRQGRYSDALEHAEQALHLYQALGDTARMAGALNDVAWCHDLLGNYEQARTFCRRALLAGADIDDWPTEGAVWDSMGYAEHHLGNLAAAAACYRRALGLHRKGGDRFREAEALSHLGDTRHTAGEARQARQAWEQALIILDDIQHPDADQVRAKLAGTAGRAAETSSR